MSRWKCPHGHIGRECVECYRDIANERGLRILQLTRERDHLAREIAARESARIAHHAPRERG